MLQRFGILDTCIKSITIHNLSVKSLKLRCIVISVHQTIASAILLFLLLLALSHAQEMTSVLHTDMDDQAEREGPLWDINPKTKTYSVNHERMLNSKRLALVTVVILYTSIAITSVYVVIGIVCVVGAIRKSPELLLPWLFVDVLVMTIFLAFLWGGDQNENFVEIFGGHWVYRIGCLILTILNIHMWLTVRCYYRALRKQIENKEISCRTNDPILPIKSSASTKSLNQKFSNVI